MLPGNPHHMFVVRLLGVLFLVALNGFLATAEFSLLVKA
jgi:hypothetical protein